MQDFDARDFQGATIGRLVWPRSDDKNLDGSAVLRGTGTVTGASWSSCPRPSLPASPSCSSPSPRRALGSFRLRDVERGLGSRRRRAHGLRGAVGDERGGHERLPLEDLGYVVGPLALGIASASVWKWRFNWRPLPKRWITATVPVWPAGMTSACAVSAQKASSVPVYTPSTARHKA